MLSGCSSSPRISGSYYLYDNDGHHMDTYIRVTGSTWEDQTGNSGNFTYTQTSTEISKETYKIQFIFLCEHSIPETNRNIDFKFLSK